MVKRRIFLTGGSGFVGNAVLTELLARNYAVRALVNRRRIDLNFVSSVNVSIFDSEKLADAMGDCDAVIHLVGIIFEHKRRGVTFERMHVEATKSVLAATKRTGIERYVHMSAAGARELPRVAGEHARRSHAQVSQYHQTKFAAEHAVRDSQLDFTIFRPSLIHGPGGEFTIAEINWARGKSAPFFFMPYFGRGIFGAGERALVQPIFVKDVSRAFVDALDRPETIGQTFCLGGADRITWPQMHRIASRVLVGKPRAVFPIPAWVGKFYAAIGIAPLLGFNRDQVLMSQENIICEMEKFAATFGWLPAGFATALRTYASQI